MKNKTTKMKNNTNTFVPNPMLEMLMAREQLMEDIDGIIEGLYFDNPVQNCCGADRLQLTATDRDELIRTLCDAVCKNFPAK